MTAPRSVRGVAAVLRWGSYLSAGIILLGMVLAVTRPDFPLQIGPAIPLRYLWKQLTTGNPYAVMQVGILLLLLTPVVRVGTAVVSFTVAGERRYALVSLVVLALILLSMWGAR